MTISKQTYISIKGAKANNLKDLTLDIPHNEFIVVTGVSGSGKSSLVFDIVAKEGQRRYFETLPSFARQFTGKLNRPNVDKIEGLSPVIAIGQLTSGIHARSTVATLSDIYDLLRLLFARTGVTDDDTELSRALFSFNSNLGKCQECNGIGKQEEIDLDKLVSNPDRTIREGALAPTLPNGYIMYSQVTIDVLNQVCESEGFNVDIPWKDLTEEQKRVILFGSEKIKVPFGKHSLESRLKWTGIKAKPREEGFYKGMIPIMSDILRRDRNANILKYVKSVICSSCNGTRLNNKALSVKVHGLTIADLTNLEVVELNKWLSDQNHDAIQKEIADDIMKQLDLLEDLGLGHLQLNRASKSLSPSEIQRIRIANQILTPLCDVLYVFDEPSVGLHKDENAKLIYHLKELVNRGNTVFVVEHNLDTISAASHIVEIGPHSGVNGGELIFNGSFKKFMQDVSLKGVSPTYDALNSTCKNSQNSVQFEDQLVLQGCTERNLKGIDVAIKLGGLNVVSGRSGAGKNALIKETLIPLIEHKLHGGDHPGNLRAHENLDRINQLIVVDHAPIGKTPRSNPATYLGISDHIRDLFSKLPESKSRGYSKSRFSFNNKGGRCESCQGAGKIQIGMHFLGNVDLVCGTCNGDRFNIETLEVKYKGKSIADIYRLSVSEAIAFFDGEKKILNGLQMLDRIGLGYLTLGQSSTTLSGGEAQRIKVANQLQKKNKGNALYVMIYPSIGLHQSNIKSLLSLFEVIKDEGNTIVCIEQDDSIIESSDWHIELGPGSGSQGGRIVHQGSPRGISKSKIEHAEIRPFIKQEIEMKGVTTHGLKNVDVSIPKNKLTVVTGLSGSGKSTLVYDTIFAESRARFTESLSTYNRSFLKQNSHAKIKFYSGLGAAIGINRKGGGSSKRSTVGTISGVNDVLRLLYSRIGALQGLTFTAQHFSFNTHLGACPDCDGIGSQLNCNPDEVIINPEKSLLDGAISSNKTIAYYGDINGQFIAILKTVASAQGWDINKPFYELNKSIQDVVLYGTGEEEWQVVWEYANKTRSGRQELKAKWLGLCNYVNDEYQRKINNKNIKSIELLLHSVSCTTCNGTRLKPELLTVSFLGYHIHAFSEFSIDESLSLLKSNEHKLDPVIAAISEVVLPGVIETLEVISALGLGYLSLSRSFESLYGGERQRVMLAGQLSANLYGVTYVLDEPTIGLDNQQVLVLSNLLKRIVSKGNTVIVVEHDITFIKEADYLIEMGPSAGMNGGEVVFQGTINEVLKTKKTITSKLFEKENLEITKIEYTKGQSFGVKGAVANNLKNIDATFYSGQIIAVTGVSGSGKSSLIKEVLYPSLKKRRPIKCKEVYGFDQFESVLLIDQNPISQSVATTVAIITGILDSIRLVYSKLEDAKSLGLKKADFSYQSKKGKCVACNGYGQVKTSMDFMSDIWLVCDSCNGLRYNNNILSCLYNAMSIGEVLKMSVTKAFSFFENDSIKQSLQVLIDVGVGHLLLGQSGNTLSGGEAQRLKLASALLEKSKGKTLYLFDEPTTGLHYFDILKLNKVFQEIALQGDTVLFIEHNKAMIDIAHQTIKLGPASGSQGGELV